MFNNNIQETDRFHEILSSETFEIHHANTIDQAREGIEKLYPDVILIRMTSEGTKEIWNLILDFQSINPLGPVIMIVDEIGLDILNRSLYYGVRDCLKLSELETTLEFSVAMALDRVKDLHMRITEVEKAKYDQQVERLKSALSYELNSIYSLQEELSNSGQQLLSVLVNALEIADPYVRGHSQRVAALAKKIAGRMNQAYLMSKEIYSMDELETAALLHDIGKLGIPDTILNKKRKLSEEEWTLIKRHPAMGADIVTSIGHLSSIADDIRYHHERWDGKGYPLGLEGEKIPIRARILALADAFDAMISPRVYRQALGLPQALEEVKKNSGTHFDPKVVEGLLWVAGEY